MRSSRSATIGIITKLMNVHSTLRIRIVTGDVPGDGSWGGLGILLEGDGSADLGVSSEGCNYEWPLLARGLCVDSRPD